MSSKNERYHTGYTLQIVLISLLLLSLPLVVAQATDVILVQTGSSIQEAIDRAPAGATIELAGGMWQENLMIDKSLSIRGRGPGETIITGKNPGHPVIRIAPGGVQTMSVTISGVAVSAGGNDCAEAEKSVCADGILAEGRARITVDDVSFTNSYAGIWLRSLVNATITRATLLGNTYGIVIAEQARANISNCTISNNREDGMIIADSARVKLNNSRITGNKNAGISVDVPPCYNTSRTFSGLIIGGNNTVQVPSADQGIPVCPEDLSVISSRDGGFYPASAAEALLSLLPAAPPMEGSDDAPVTIIEFTDFTCPYCNKFATETLPQIEENYIDTGKAKLYFLPFPVHGEGAYRAAEAAFCAQEQGLFWDFQRLLIAQYKVRGSTVLTPAWLATIASATGADHDQFMDSLTAGTYAHAVQETVALGENLGVDGTPTFFINGRRIPGAAPYKVFAQMIDAELNKK